MTNEREHLRNSECVDANAWAEAFMAVKDEADLHEVSLWFSSCLLTAFVHGQREPSYSSLQRSRPAKSSGSSGSRRVSSAEA